MNIKYTSTAILIFVVGIMGIFIFSRSKDEPTKPMVTSNAKIRYVAVGDSYTIGQGVLREESWPELLVNHLRQEGIAIELVANPARTGYTTQDAIDEELPIFEQSKPEFATLLIGANDWARGLSAEAFRAKYTLLLDRMIATLPNKKNIVIITIPDFSVTPRGAQFSGSRNISQGIVQYNEVIKQEASRRNVTVVDIFTLSQDMGKDPSLVVSDGLHPSGKAYATWEALIFPHVLKLLKTSDTTNNS